MQSAKRQQHIANSVRADKIEKEGSPMERSKRTSTSFTRKLSAVMFAVIMASLMITPAYAAETDGWTSVISWGDNLADNIKLICKCIAGIAVLILAILCISGGREWVNKLKSVGGGILVGIVIASYGTSLVMGLFA